MPESTYDTVVIGSGPGGYVAAIRAAQLGMKTAVIESDRVGGRCLNYACIPAKAVLRVADVLTEIREAGDYGIKVGTPEIDYPGITSRRLKVVSTLTGGVAGLLKKNKIDLIEGTGALVGAGQVSVNGSDEITAKTIVLATGSVKRSIPGVQFGGRVIGTEEAWALDELPASLAVVGAGASGSEIASAYARLGSEVLLFEALERVLPTEDADISKIAERGFKKQGITVHTNTLVEEIESRSDSVTFTYGGSGEGEVQWLVIAAGRAPDIEGLGLDTAGVKLDDRGLIEVDGAMRTSLDGVYAIGDLVPGPALAHKASDEGVIAVEDAAGLPTHPIEYIERRQLRADRGPGPRAGPRRHRRQGPVRSGRRRHRVWRPERPGQDRRRQALRRAARGAHRRLEGDRTDPGARQRALAGGRLSRDRASCPRAPDDVRSRDGSRTRGRRLADPRLSGKR
jgi:dihydrolipoamide dehydrogenase